MEARGSLTICPDRRADERGDKLTPENTRNHPIGGKDLNKAAQLRLKPDSFDAGFSVPPATPASERTREAPDLDFCKTEQNKPDGTFWHIHPARCSAG
jgi:hypothetical protein